VPTYVSALYEDGIHSEHNNATASKSDIQSFGSLQKRGSGFATLGTCKSLSLDMSGYSNTKIITFYELAFPDTLDPTFGTYNPWPPNVEDNGGNPPQPILTTAENNAPIFAREHVYELSMCACLIARCSSPV